MLGDDFPKSLIEFEKRFATEKQCRDYLYKLKFPNGFICEKCGHNEFWWTKKDLLFCKECNHQTSLRTGTIFENSKKPLMLWYRALFLVSFQKVGISAKNLQHQLGFGSYQTAWSWLQKIRRSMRRIGREKLDGEVEVDEANWGGKSEGKRGRGAENKHFFAVGVEVGARNKIGRIRMELIEDASGPELSQFIYNNVNQESTVYTDGWRSYGILSNMKYKHEVIKNKDPDKVLPRVNLIVSQFKRWLLGIHQGIVSKKHLQLYLDEFVFRFNRRTSKSRGKVFYRLLQQSISYKATPYWRLVGRVAQHVPLRKSA